MLILVRQTRVRGDKVLDQRDLEWQDKTLRVGRGKGQDIQLSGGEVGLEHAQVTPRSDDGLRIVCKGRNRIQVGERDCRRATLAAGEWAWVGPHRLSPMQAPPGFDAAIEVRIDADAYQSSKQRLASDLRLKLPNLRFYSWLLLFVVALFGLGLPMLGYYDDSAADAIARIGGPSDQLWSTGALADAHHVQGLIEDCNACHEKPFQQVQNQACLECHQELTGHFTPAHPATEGFDDRCQACHKEHNEPSNLIVAHDALCTDCHSQAQQRLAQAAPPVGTTPVAAAPDRIDSTTGFSAAHHPQFTVSLLRHSQSDWQIERLRLGAGKSSSGLKFPHDTHLDHAKVSFADGPSREDRALDCVDCHTLEREGEHFEPITMESTCVGCHTLAFDDVQPDRQLPHGEPQVLRTYLEEYYVRQAAGQRQQPPGRSRPLPNASAEPQASARRCDGDPLACGLARADAEMEKLFTKAGCVSCHEVYQENDQWQVRPVRLVQDWYAAARFDHVPHLNPGARADGATCLGCHAAATSSEAQDVLMPGIESCGDCHSENRDDGIVLQCVDCHGFHRPGLAWQEEH